MTKHENSTPADLELEAMKQMGKMMDISRTSRYKIGSPQESMRRALLTAEAFIKKQHAIVLGLNSDLSTATQALQVERKISLSGSVPPASEFKGGDESVAWCKHRPVQFIVWIDNNGEESLVTGQGYKCLDCGGVAEVSAREVVA